MTDSALAPQLTTAGEGPPIGWRWALRVAPLVPIVVAVVRALARGWFPIGDDALLTLRAADVLTRHHPLLGSWTSASLALGTDVNNPGPLYDDLLAPFMWAIGRPFGYAAGVAVGVGALNAAAALGIVLVGARLGGWRAERWMLLLVAALTWSMGSELLFDIWQPHALLLPFTLLVILTVAVASGDRALAPVWIGVLSLVVQTHIGYAYVAAALFVLVVVTHARDAAARRDRRTQLWVAAVAIAAWIQPLWEQLFGEGRGNLARLAASAGGGEHTIGAGNAVRLLGAVLVVPPGWTRWGFEDAVQPAPLEETPAGTVFRIPGLPSLAIATIGLVVLVGVLAWLVVSLRDVSQRVARWSAGVALLLVVVAAATLAVQVVGVTGLGSHQVRWIFAMAAIVHVTIVWGLVEHVRGRIRLRFRSDVAVIAVVAVLAGWNLGFMAHALGPVGDRRAADTLRPVFDDLARFRPAGPVVYDVDNFLVFEPYSSAVIMRLVEHGVDVRLDHEGYLRQYGPSRRADGTERVRVYQYERIDALRYSGPGCLISRHSGLAPADAAAADALIDAAAADLAGRAIDSGGLPDDVAALVEAATVDPDAAYRLVAGALLPMLVGEGRLDATEAIHAAVAGNDAIVARVNTTLALVADPPIASDPLCER